jgi:hypothetical protein
VLHSVLYADAADVATHLRTLFEDRIERVTVDERTNRLVVLATRDMQLEVVRLLTQLDLPRGNDGAVRTLRVSHAKAADAAAVIESLRRNDKAGGRARKSSGRARRRAPASQPTR